MEGKRPTGVKPPEEEGLAPETQRVVLEALERATSQARAEMRLHARRTS
jgi:hypothetical protein